ncbi:MAG: hypothetical protein ACXVRK_02795 [Gaiellaceae bacterium]
MAAPRDPVKLDFVQPSWRRREWELRRGGEVVAVLRVPAFRRSGVAEIGGRRFAIELESKNAVVVRDEASGEEHARLRKRVLELGGRSLEWKGLGRGKGFGFVGEDGEPLVRARITTGLTRMHGEVELADGSGDDALIAALVASFLLVRKGDATGGAVAASIAASA